MAIRALLMPPAALLCPEARDADLNVPARMPSGGCQAR
jgi:hypothetical protein